MAVRLKDRIEANIRQSDKVNSSLSIQLNSGTATVYNGSAAKTINVTPAAINAVNKSGDTMTGVLNAHGGITLNSTTQQSDGPEYILGIKAFASGGNIVWASKANVSVGAADKLTTARTINGTNFNGTANITTANWGTSRNFTIGSTTKAVNGSAAMNWSYKEIGISKDYSSFATASTNTWGWYTIATIADSATSPALFLIKAYAHSSLIFTVTKGYSTYGSLNVLDYNSSSNQDYASISGVRLMSDGRIQLQLRTKKTTNASQNAIVDISINVINSSDTLTLATSLIADDTASPSVIVTRSCTTTGAIIASSFVGKASSASIADAVAWANITGKPSTFAPSSHTHSYLPLTGGSISGNVSFSAAASGTSPISQRISINGVNNDTTVANAPGIGFHIGGINWGSLKFQSDGSFRFYDSECTGYKPIYGSQVYGAVWNDYAEYRETKYEVRPGRVVSENGDDTLSQTYKRLQPACSIVSDTFGFAIGETEKCKTPLAMAGRVLTYPYEDRDSYKPGDAVCSGPNGTVSKMTYQEKIMYPECIIGYVSCVPTYETWGEKNTKVDGRIWIKVI